MLSFAFFLIIISAEKYYPEKNITLAHSKYFTHDSYAPPSCAFHITVFSAVYDYKTNQEKINGLFSDLCHK